MSLKWCYLMFFSVLVNGGEAKRPPPSYFEYDKIQARILNKTLSLKEDALSLQDNFLTDQSMGWHSFSQKEPKQDVIIDTIFNDKSDGYFVDLAANDWQYLSNTLMLEYFNHWKGVCIEPNPQYLEGLLSNRKCKIYINPVSSATGDVVKFNFEGVLGGMVGNEFDNKHESTSVVELTTVTLESILDHANMPSVIDYFSLDVEGAEYHVLVNFNYTRYTFLTMTIERPSAKIHHLLVNNGYRYVYILCNFGDTLYVHHTLPNFVEIMNKHHNPNNVMWNREAHPYLLHPKWLGSYIPVHNSSEEIPIVERKTRIN